MIKQRRLKLNVSMRGYPAGKIIRITCDLSGKPTDSYWHKRLIDAEKDSCCELIEEKKPVKAVKPEKVSKSNKKDGLANDA